MIWWYTNTPILWDYKTMRFWGYETMVLFSLWNWDSLILWKLWLSDSMILWDYDNFDILILWGYQAMRFCDYGREYEVWEYESMKAWEYEYVCACILSTLVFAYFPRFFFVSLYLKAFLWPFFQVHNWKLYVLIVQLLLFFLVSFLRSFETCLIPV